MFTDADRKNLIKELNKELETNMFYNNPLISNKSKVKTSGISDYEASNVSFESVPKFAGNIAFSDTVFDSPISLDDISFDEKDITVPSVSFNTDGLFRPLVNKNAVNLNNKIYNYSASYATPVHGIAFESRGCGNVENPLTKPCNIVNSVYANSPSWIENKKDASVHEDKTEKEIYKMADVLKDTKKSQIISFTSVPKELSLVTATPKWKSILYKEIDLKGILFKEIDIKGAFKNAFGKNKK